jgi:hypothetical protein
MVYKIFIHIVRHTVHGDLPILRSVEKGQSTSRIGEGTLRKLVLVDVLCTPSTFLATAHPRRVDFHGLHVREEGL